MNNVLLEGDPGVGKTTLLRKIAEGISHLGIGGFHTQEIREKGRRVGFRIETFSGESGILSHTKFKTGPRVGKYRVDVPGFERIGVGGLERALSESTVILIDEIGKMELFSERFKEVVTQCLDSEKVVLATIMSRSHPFVDGLKIRYNVEVLKVTIGNRVQLESKLIKEIMSKCASRASVGLGQN
ncbi:MAG: NTPase [Thermodesulfobacteriota bacterium]|nr:NTPase [Thermodesulfobacteriota bacterium]